MGKFIMNRHKLIFLLTLVLALGGISISLMSYSVSKASIHRAISDNELPLTADNVYSEIQRDLVRPVFISSMMASDTFLRDWVLDGERRVDSISKYLQEIQSTYGTFISFFVSEKTRQYYYGNGVLKKVQKTEPRDVWYFRVRDLNQPYEINVDKDLAHQDALTIFVNYRVYDYAKNYIGAVGVGLTVDSVKGLIDGYQEKFRRSVYFITSEGTVMLSGSKQHISGSHVRELPELHALLPQITSQETGSFEYRYKGSDRLINTRYIPELKWYLIVEKNESEATQVIRNTLYINLGICLLLTALAVYLTNLALKRYQTQIETMATTDSLTHLPNRKAFEIIIDVIMQERIRYGKDLAVILLDIDHFKQINDRHGHFAGDQVLTEVALIIRSCLRSVDFVCRWGGEEFLILLKDCSERNARLLAEKIRETLETRPVDHKNVPIHLTASLGVAMVQNGERIEQVLERADYAMYQAKALGRNQVIFSNFKNG
jgi:diguanylate cyclase (GGDEF)-like protein